MFLAMLRGLITVFVVLASSAMAADMRVLVDREHSGISVYFTTPASTLPSVFGAGAEELLQADGTVDIDGLYRGTFDTADDIFADVRAHVGGAPFGFEALSMMVHDPAILPEFATPFDAAMSIAVCNSPETVRNMGLGELHAYLGFYAWKADPMAEVALTFPATGRDSFEVEVLDFAPNGDLRVTTQDLTDGGLLILTAPPAPRYATLGPLLAGMALLVLAGAAMALARRKAS